MCAYDTLAGAYDGLTRDIDYAGILNFLETVLQRENRHPETVLDLACGTGSMSVLLAQRGYEVIGADLSEEMLTFAAQKAGTLEHPPLFIHQAMQELQLPGPVDCVFCLLDSLNYVTEPADVRETMRRVYQNLTPGGVFVFDINTPFKLHSLDGEIFLDENEESYCVWRAEFDRKDNCCYYGIDLFCREGDLWRRSFEQHCEYAYEPEELISWLRKAGFSRILTFGDCRMAEPEAEEQRIYFAAIKE